MNITIQYFEGCPHWRLADERIRKVLKTMQRNDFNVDYQLIDSPETAERVGFHGSPTILIDGSDPFVTGHELVGMTCRVYHTERGSEGAPSEAQLRAAIS